MEVSESLDLTGFQTFELMTIIQIYSVYIVPMFSLTVFLIIEKEEEKQGKIDQCVIEQNNKKWHTR